MSYSRERNERPFSYDVHKPMTAELAARPAVRTKQNNGYLLRADQAPKRDNRAELFATYAWCIVRECLVMAKSGGRIKPGTVIPHAFTEPTKVYGFYSDDIPEL